VIQKAKELRVDCRLASAYVEESAGRKVDNPLKGLERHVIPMVSDVVAAMGAVHVAGRRDLAID
jgi:hypothetical protein